MVFIAVGLLAALAIVMIAFTIAWPFTRDKVVRDLQEATGSKMSIGKFHYTYFPPGCVAENVTVVPADGTKGAVLKIARLTISSSYHKLLAKRIKMMIAGADFTLPALGGQPFPFHLSAKSKATIEEIGATDSVLEFTRQQNGNKPLRFEIHQLTVKHPAKGAPLHIDAKLRIPEPQGELELSGKFGPWYRENPMQTEVSGSYQLHGADLGSFGGMRGSLSSSGKFSGQLQKINVKGSTDTPDFEVVRSGHKMHLVANFQAEVDGSNGDVTLQQVQGSFGKTDLNADGQVAAEKGQGKVAHIQFEEHEGTIQDVLMMFITAPQSPVTGDLKFNAVANLRGEHRPFLQEVLFTSDFAIDRGHFTKPGTQQKINQLSQQAQGEKQSDDPTMALSDLTGHVELKDGIAHFSNLKFRVPGALAKLHGTYDLRSQTINIQGLLLMEADLPHATSGIKSFLLKPLNVFLKKNHHGGARVPITLTGTYDHPVYKMDPI